MLPQEGNSGEKNERSDERIEQNGELGSIPEMSKFYQVSESKRTKSFRFETAAKKAAPPPDAPSKQEDKSASEKVTGDSKEGTKAEPNVSGASIQPKQPAGQSASLTPRLLPLPPDHSKDPPEEFSPSFSSPPAATTKAAPPTPLPSGVASPEVASPGVASPEAASPEAASPEAAPPSVAEQKESAPSFVLLSTLKEPKKSNPTTPAMAQTNPKSLNVPKVAEPKKLRAQPADLCKNDNPKHQINNPSQLQEPSPLLPTALPPSKPHNSLASTSNSLPSNSTPLATLFIQNHQTSPNNSTNALFSSQSFSLMSSHKQPTQIPPHIPTTIAQSPIQKHHSPTNTSNLPQHQQQHHQPRKRPREQFSPTVYNDKILNQAQNKNQDQMEHKFSNLSKTVVEEKGPKDSIKSSQKTKQPSKTPSGVDNGESSENINNVQKSDNPETKSQTPANQQEQSTKMTEPFTLTGVQFALASSLPAKTTLVGKKESSFDPDDIQHMAVAFSYDTRGGTNAEAQARSRREEWEASGQRTRRQIAMERMLLADKAKNKKRSSVRGSQSRLALNWNEGPQPQIGPGWTLTVKGRGDGSGRADRYWFSPTGKRFRSGVEIERFKRALEEVGSNDEEKAYALFRESK